MGGEPGQQDLDVTRYDGLSHWAGWLLAIAAMLGGDARGAGHASWAVDGGLAGTG
jgi:hypothetical protein